MLKASFGEESSQHGYELVTKDVFLFLQANEKSNLASSPATYRSSRE
jgi:hypothetical protein